MTTPAFLDWRHAQIGDPAPCVRCRRPALLRNPDTGRPEHKVCAEAALSRTQKAETETT